MPQGGIDEGEDPYKAALRELYEETNIRSVEKLGEIADWLTYDIPRDIVGQAWGGKYRGQKQKWYALRFTGERQRDRHRASRRRARAGIRRLALGARWTNLPDLVVPFKRPTYERVVQEFGEVRDVTRRACPTPGSDASPCRCIAVPSAHLP